MVRTERIRELVTSPVTQDVLQQRASSGWHLEALEWRREVESAHAEHSVIVEEVPYGLRVASDCHHLEADPAEEQTLLRMMELMVQDFPLSEVAAQLNATGSRTRAGAPWGPVSVFNMLPRLIEAGPRLFSGEEWEARRKRFIKAD